jgi:SAM-dependent methyltransferase
VFSLDLPQNFNLASVNSAIPKSTTVAPYLSATRIQASAWLYGIDGAAPDRARILDIGCGDASHLMPFALAYPQAEIIGIDLSSEKIEAGQLQFKLAGIKNTQLFCTDLENLLAGLGVQFDYIIIHNIFSLLDSQTREALFAFCQQHLTSQGVVATEWLTQPGAGVSQIIQDAIALHARDANSDELRLSSARAALTWLSLGMSQHPAREALQELISEAEAMDDETFALRYLHGMNNASYFVDFHESVTRSGLRYVGDLFPGKSALRITATRWQNFQRPFVRTKINCWFSNTSISLLTVVRALVCLQSLSQHRTLLPNPISAACGISIGQRVSVAKLMATARFIIACVLSPVLLLRPMMWSRCLCWMRWAKHGR